MRICVCEMCGLSEPCRSKARRFCPKCSRLRALANSRNSKDKYRNVSRYRAYVNRHKKIGDPSPVITMKEMITLWSQDCVYCGRPGGSIDRIDSSLGYSSSNTQPTCLRCNLMKWQDTEEEFLEHVKRVYMFKISVAP